MSAPFDCFAALGVPCICSMNLSTLLCAKGSPRLTGSKADIPPSPFLSVCSRSAQLSRLPTHRFLPGHIFKFFDQGLKNLSNPRSGPYPGFQREEERGDGGGTEKGYEKDTGKTEGLRTGRGPRSLPQGDPILCRGTCLIGSLLSPTVWGRTTKVPR